MDPYQVLGVAPYASDDEIKTVYRKLSRKYHPDANIGKPDAEAAEEKFKQVSWAYEEIMKIRSEGYSYTSQAGPRGPYTAASSYGSSTGRTAYGQTGTYNTGSTYGSGAYNTGSTYRNRSAGTGSAFYSGGFGNGTVLRFDLGQINTIGLGGDTYIYNAAISFLNQGMYKEAGATLDTAAIKAPAWYFLSALANLGMGNIINARQHATMAYNMEPDNPQYWQLLKYFNKGPETYREYKTTEKRYYHTMPSERRRFNSVASCVSFGLCLGANWLCNPRYGSLCR